MRKILVLNASYTLEMIRERKLDEPILIRDIEGYFDNVWSVHPFATINTPNNISATFGGLSKTVFSKRHTIIEGKIGRFKFMRFFPILNFFLSQIELLFYLGKLIKKENINVIRSDDPQYIGLLGFLLSRMYKIAFVIRIGSNWDKYYEETGSPAMPRLFKKRWIEKIVERFVFRRADLVAGANLDNLNYAINNGARKEFTTLFRYGNLLHQSHRVSIDERPSADDIISDLGLASHQFAIYIGRLEPVKMPDHIIMAVAELKKRGYNLKGLMVGDGSKKKSLIEMAEGLNIKEDIIFAGNRSQEWIARVLPYATVVLSPHTGRALAEAALSGVPIVAYNIDWQPELIKTGKTGELVEYRNWHAMADAAVKMLDDPMYAKRMGANVRKAAMEMMDSVKLNEHERNEYDKLFARFYKDNKERI
ncbi:MAG: glycosyltransferase [Candidatus Kuenenia sp.]|nr:glycosyltransferase [Candidatus Kuenenia sp.]